ncbi:MAG TPA: YbaK/EbsC family protein [Candidatus Eisenbacteria bacterium]|nr:YbaK/EbsC family protein [Candidatus Eisenbacteria bacterium]
MEAAQGFGDHQAVVARLLDEVGRGVRERLVAAADRQQGGPARSGDAGAGVSDGSPDGATDATTRNAAPDQPTAESAAQSAAESPAESSTPATRALAESGVDHRIIRTESAGSAEEAAQLQGIPLGALLRTIVVRRGDDDYLFVLIPAGRRFDWPKLRKHLGVTRLSLPDADEAQAVTGYVRYTITPFGSTRAWPVLVDASVMAEPVVSVGGGARGVNIHVAPEALVECLNADLVDVTAPEPG